MITKEIEQAIITSLPKLAGEAVQERLKRADELERLYATAKEHDKDQANTVAQLAKELSAANALIKSMDDRRKALEEGEADLRAGALRLLKAEAVVDVTALKARLEERDRSMKAMIEFMSSVTKNTVYRETIMGNSNKYDPNTGGNSNSSSSLTTERSKE